MPALQVKDCPAETYEKLRMCATEENRSISQQMLTIIQDYLAMRDAGLIAPRSGATPHASSASAPFARPRFSYAPIDDGIDYGAKHRAVLERLAQLPPIPVSECSPSSEKIIAQIRKEEMR